MNWLLGGLFVCAFLGATGYIQKAEQEYMKKYERQFKEKKLKEKALRELKAKACYMTNCNWKAK